MYKGQISHEVWGDWPSIRLSTDAVQLEVASEVGGRVISLRDKRRDREWLSQGSPPSELEQMAWAREDATFGGRESFGWDECLPTTSVCADPLAPGGPDLRDHGDQWGRGAYLSLDEARGAVEHTWSVPRWDYRFHRRLSFEDAQTVLAEYVAVSHASEPLPVQWAQHAVLRLEPGSHLDLPGVTRVGRSFQLGIDLPTDLNWPIATTTDGEGIDLARTKTDTGWAAVVYAEALAGARAVTPDGACLELEWDLDFAPVLRVWQDYGGWPTSGEPVEQVALEPCSSAHDHLAGALADGQERMLPPGAELRWWVRLRLS
jgi:galactose mutarotase-like enzyme